MARVNSMETLDRVINPPNLCFLDLPLSIIDLAARFLTIADIVRCSCVCRAMRTICQDLLTCRQSVTTRDVMSPSIMKSLSALRLVMAFCKSLKTLDVCLPPRGWSENIILEPMVLLTSRASHIVRLVLVNVDISDHALVLLANSAQRLKHLELGSTEHDVPNNSVGDKGIMSIARRCAELESVVLLRCYHVGDKSLKALAQHQENLRSLRLRACPEVSKAGIIAISEGCTRLQVLDLVAVRHFRFHALVDDDVTATLGSCTKSLREIRLCEEALGASLIDDSCLVPLVAGCQRLETVELHGADVSDKALFMIGESCASLKTLILKNTWATYHGIEAVAKGCPCLQSLTMNGCWIRTLGGPPGGPVDSWASPLVAASGVFPPVMQSIAMQFPCLIQLDLSDLDTNPVSPLAVLLESSFLPNLKVLSLRWSRICDPVAAGSNFDATVCGIVGRCVNLEALNMEGFPGNMDEVLVSACRALSSLSILDISCTRVTEAGFQYLAVSGLRLTCLNLSCCHNIRGTGLSTIWPTTGRTLKDVNLYGLEGISDSTISEILEHCPNLAYLNVGRGFAGNEITSEGLKQLRSAGNVQGLEIDVLPRKRGYRRGHDWPF